MIMNTCCCGTRLFQLNMVLCTCAARVIEKLKAAGFMNTTEHAEAAGRKKANTEGTSLKAKRQLLTRSEDGGLPVEVIGVKPSFFISYRCALRCSLPMPHGWCARVRGS